MRRVDDSFGERAVPVLTEIAGEISILTQVGEPGRVPMPPVRVP